MVVSKDLTWVRIAVEAIVIIGSILLAFWIEAWADDRVERNRASELLVAIRADVDATQQHIRDNIAFRGKVVANSQALLRVLAGGEDSSNLNPRLLSLGSIFIMSSWHPINHSYEQALGSGSFELVRDAELRLLLAQYVGALTNVTDNVDQVNEQYRGQLEPFMVANTVYSELAAPDVREALVSDAPFATDLDALASSRELWNLLTLKLEIEAILVSNLEEAGAKATALLVALSDST